MSRIIQILLICATITSLSSCFFITEEIDMNTDGSGNAKFIVNLSESKQNIANFMQMGQVDGHKIPSQIEIDEIIAKIKNTLTGVKGFSNVAVQSNYQDFIFRIEGAFVNIEVLNQGATAVARALSNNTTTTVPNNFKYQNGQFNRLFPFPLDAAAYNKMPSMQQYVLEMARVTGIYRFPNTVDSFSNESAQLSPSKKSVKLESTIGDIARGTKTLENTIIIDH